MKPDYLNAFISAVFGALFSAAFIYIGYVVEKKRGRKQASKALRESLKFNDDRAVQMLGQFSKGITPNYQFDTTGLIIWISKSDGLFDDALVGEINWHRYQMDHANTMLASYYVIDPTTGDPAGKAGIESASRRAVIESLLKIHNGTHKLLTEIERQSTR